MDRPEGLARALRQMACRPAPFSGLTVPLQWLLSIVARRPSASSCVTLGRQPPSDFLATQLRPIHFDVCMMRFEKRHLPSPKHTMLSQPRSNLSSGTFAALRGLLAGDSAICGRLAALTLRLAACRFAIWGGHQKGSFSSPQRARGLKKFDRGLRD